MIHDMASVARHKAQRVAVAAQASAGGGEGGEYLTLRLGAEEYGIDILRVQEIRSYQQPTRIANAPAFMKGVVNLRGVIVPILDLRVKLGCEKVEFDASTVVIVLNIAGRVVGAVVDGVSDVLRFSDGQVRPAPELGRSVIDTSYITGIGSLSAEGRERMLILLNIVALMRSPDMGLLEQAAVA